MYDLLFVAMGVWLQRQHGAENVVLVTGDQRIAAITRRAKSPKLAKPIKRHLRSVARSLGMKYSPAIYPTVVDIAHPPKKELEAALPDWSEPW